MALGDDYRKALVRKYDFGTGWIANWPPGNDVSVGMVGCFEKGSFSRTGWLHDPSRGVAWDRDPYPGTADGVWHFQTENSVKIETRLKGEIDSAWEFIGQAKAGVKFSFANGGGIIVSTISSHEEHIADLKALKDNIIAAYNDGRRMDQHEVIITAIRVAGPGFVLMSHKSGGEVRATTDADVGLTEIVNLADLAIGINIATQSNMAAASSYPNGFAIAFQGIELIRNKWLWLPKRWRFGHITTMPVRRHFRAVEDSEDEIFLELPKE